MQDLFQDLKVALRGLRSRPGMTAVIVASLGLGIAGVTLLFSIINVLFLRPLPFEDADRVVRLRAISVSEEGDPTIVGTSERAYFNLLEDNTVFSSIATQDYGSFIMVGSREPQRLEGAYVTANLLPTLGVSPILGRNMTPQEDRPGGGNVVLLGYDVWTRQFGADEDVLGTTVRLNDSAYTVIGVMPQHFQFPYSAEIWVPLQVTDTNPDRLGNHYLFTVARLKPGVTAAQATQEIEAVGRRLADEYPDEHGGWDLMLNPIRQELTQDIQEKLLYALLGAAAFLLLIACANVGGMLLARGLEQEQDMAVRAALGSSRRRLMQRLVVQGVTLSLAGGAFGLILTSIGLKPLVALSPLADMDAFFRNVTPDARVLLFVLAVSLVVGIAFSLPAALQVSRPDVRSLLNEQSRGSTGRGGRRFLSGLVVAEVAVAVVLLVGAGLMLGNVQELFSVDPGFGDDVLTAHLALPDGKYPSHESRVSFLRQAVEEVESLPGVEAVGVTSTHPMDAARIATLVAFEGHPPANPGDVTITNHRLVTPGYFQTMDIPLLAGRYLDQRDAATAPMTVVVSRTLAELHWTVDTAVGKRVKRGRFDADAPWLTVVGVVEDVADLGDFENTWYVPYTQHEFQVFNVALTAKTSSDPLSLASPVRRAIWDLDPEQPIYDVSSNRQMFLDNHRQERFSVLVMGLFAGLGLILALIGVYGILSYNVLQQRRDIGVRMALGAERRDVVRQVVRRGVVMATAGLAVGVTAALLLNRFLSSRMDQLGSADPWLYVAIAGLMLLVAAVASLLPALRASRVEPVTVLRTE